MTSTASSLYLATVQKLLRQSNDLVSRSSAAVVSDREASMGRREKFILKREGTVTRVFDASPSMKGSQIC